MILAEDLVDPPETRPLAGFERVMLEVADSMGADLVVLRVEGPVDPDRLQRALHRVAERHPMLRARLGPGPTFLVDPHPPRIPLVVAPAPPLGPAWPHLAEAMLRTRFAPAEGGLLRAGISFDRDGVHVVIAAHHAIVDGPSLGIVGHDVLRAMAGTLPEEPRPLPRPVVLRRGAWAGSRLARPVVERVWAAGLKRHAASPWVPSRGTLAPGALPQPGIAFVEGPPGSGAALLAATRRHGVTVGAALAAAVRLELGTWQAEHGRDPLRDPVGLELQVGLRGRVDGLSREDVAFGASGLRVAERLRSGQDFWDLASRLGRGVRLGLRAGVPEIAWASVGSLDGLRAGLSRHRIDLAPVGGTGHLAALSNVGPWGHGVQYGDLRLTGAWSLCGPALAGPALLVWARTVGDRWFLSAMGSSPFVDAATVRRRLDAIGRRIVAAADGEPGVAADVAPEVSPA